MNDQVTCIDGDKNKGWDTREKITRYFNNSFLQFELASCFLSKLSDKNIGIRNMKNGINHLGEDDSIRILDYGCGDGKITALQIANNFPRAVVFGFDISKNMIEIATARFPIEKYNYLYFTNNMSNVNTKFDLVTSFCVFHLIADPESVLKMIWTKMKPKAQLIMVVPTCQNNVFMQMRDEMLEKYGILTSFNSSNDNSSKEKKFMRTVDDCKEILGKSGFSITDIELVLERMPFFSRNDLIDWCMGTLSANWGVPDHISKEFFTEFINKFLNKSKTIGNYDDENLENGFVYLRWHYIKIQATAIPVSNTAIDTDTAIFSMKSSL